MNNYIRKKYNEFFIKKNYIPKMFNPYNTKEIIDFAPTITANVGNASSSSAVLIIEECKKDE